MRPLNVFIIALIFFIQCSFQLKSKLSSSSSSQNNHENNHNQNNDHTELKKQQAELDELLKKYTKDELMVFSLLFQGQNQFNEGKYQECKETFEQMTKLAPTVDYGWSNWGLCLERLGNVSLIFFQKNFLLFYYYDIFFFFFFTQRLMLQFKHIQKEWNILPKVL